MNLRQQHTHLSLSCCCGSRRRIAVFHLPQSSTTMATQLVPGMPGWRPDHPCFTGTKFFDFYGWRVPLLEPGLEWCALIENVKFNPYLEWAEVGSRRGKGPGRVWAGR